MIVKKVSVNDLKNICRIHLRSFDKSHFTSVLPQELLFNYYTYILKYNEFCLAVYDENNKNFLGFVLGGKNTGKAIDEFLRNNYSSIFISLLKHPKFILEKANIMLIKFIKRKSKPSSANYRLLSIAVDSTSQRLGLGKILLNTFEDELIKNKIFLYGLSVRNSNKKAINFYLKNGFQKEFEYTGNIYFVKQLNDQNRVV